MSKLKKDKIALILYARFPSEMAYGNHLIQIANSFIKNDFDVNIYFPRTYNSKTIFEKPESFYDIKNNMNFVEVDNFDVTSYKLYEILPSFLKMLTYSINTLIWSRKLKKYLSNEDYVWSTNPNILLVVKKFFKFVIYEKHGAARFIQKYSITKLKKDSSVTLIGVTEKSVQELTMASRETLYLPNGVDSELFFPQPRSSKENLTVGYIGFLETYGVDKGVLNAVKEIVKINEDTPINTLIAGGPNNKINEISKYIKIKNQSDYFDIKSFVPHKKVSEILSNIDIGIIPYPGKGHMNLYASPLKIFEFAACGIPILASNITSHLELEKLNLGIYYFQHDNFDDFRNKLIDLIGDKYLREDLRKKSLNNIKNLYWENRTKTILKSVRSSTG